MPLETMVQYIGLEVFVFAGSIVLIWNGVKRGLIDRRYIRGAEVYEGKDAIGIAILYLALAAAGFASGAVLLWAWKNDQIVW